MEVALKLEKSLRHDIEKGLESKIKYIPSKYFYDETGSKIFQDIMKLPGYYLTRSEEEIFNLHGENIVSLLGNDIEIIELGAGDGLKTGILMDNLIQSNYTFNYTAIDISQKALNDLKNSFCFKFPGLSVKEKCGDYFEMLHELNLQNNKRKVVLFLGSNLGNYTIKESVSFLKGLAGEMNKGDLLILGLDLKKDPETILKAYNDSRGITKQFNINLLNRLNKELGADFKPEQFEHVPYYNPVTGTAYSSLVSKCDQNVYFRFLDKSFSFDAWEAIHTEISQKYDQKLIEKMSDESGFRVFQNFYDHRKYFTDTIWIKVN